MVSVRVGVNVKVGVKVSAGITVSVGIRVSVGVRVLDGIPVGVLVRVGVLVTLTADAGVAQLVTSKAMINKGIIFKWDFIAFSCVEYPENCSVSPRNKKPLSYPSTFSRMPCAFRIPLPK